MGVGSSGSLIRTCGGVTGVHLQASNSVPILRAAQRGIHPQPQAPLSARCPAWSFPATAALLPAYQPGRAVSSSAMVPSVDPGVGPQTSGSSSPTMYVPPPLNRVTPPNSGMTSREKPAAWRSMAATLASTPASHSVPPERFIAGLNEVAAAAADKKQFPEMLQDQHFVNFLQRLAARLFGFSSYESYLMLASLLRIPRLASAQIGSQLLTRAIQQLAEEADNLGSVQFGHTSVLLGQAITQLRSTAPRPQAKHLRGRPKKGRPSAIQVSLEASEVERCLVIYEEEYLPVLQERASELCGKGLALALQGIVESRAAVPQDCLRALLLAAAIRLPEVSPTRQLPTLLFDLAQLGCADLEFCELSEGGSDKRRDDDDASSGGGGSGSGNKKDSDSNNLRDLGQGGSEERAGSDAAIAVAAEATGTRSVLLSGLELVSLSAREQLPRALAQCLEVASFLAEAGCEDLELMLQPLLQRASILASFANATEAIHLLRALCLLGRYDVQTFMKLLKVAASVPRTSLAAAEDDALHQVALSLLHDPAAAGVLATAQTADSGELWEQLFQPEDVVGDRAGAGARAARSRRGGAPDSRTRLISMLAKLLETEPGISVLAGSSAADGFYSVPLVIDGAAKLAVDVGLHSPTWQRSPTTAYERLKQRHIQLLVGETLWCPAGLSSKDSGEARQQEELPATAERIARLVQLRIAKANSNTNANADTNAKWQ